MEDKVKPDLIGVKKLDLSEFAKDFRTMHDYAVIMEKYELTHSAFIKNVREAYSANFLTDEELAEFILRIRGTETPLLEEIIQECIKNKETRGLRLICEFASEIQRKGIRALGDLRALPELVYLSRNAPLLASVEADYIIGELLIPQYIKDNDKKALEKITKEIRSKVAKKAIDGLKQLSATDLLFGLTRNPNVPTVLRKDAVTALYEIRDIMKLEILAGEKDEIGDHAIRALGMLIPELIQRRAIDDLKFIKEKTSYLRDSTRAAKGIEKIQSLPEPAKRKTNF